jgi:excisionase family DNA binding protein
MTELSKLLASVRAEVRAIPDAPPPAETSDDSQLRKIALTVPEAAWMCGISARTINRYITTRELPAVKLGHSVRIRRVDLDQFLEENLKK